MNIEYMKENGIDIAVVSSDEMMIVDTQSALDLAMTVKYVICEDFFVLSTGIAGEILQKFINYQVKVAVYGDYSHYISKPLKDFIYESNHGKDFFFVSTKEEAIRKLAEAQ